MNNEKRHEEKYEKEWRIVLLLAKHKNIHVVAHELAISEEEVKRILAIVKEAAKARIPRGKLPDKKKEKVVEMYLKGKKISEIAQSLGVSVPTIYYVLYVSGIRPNRHTRIKKKKDYLMEREYEESGFRSAARKYGYRSAVRVMA